MRAEAQHYFAAWQRDLGVSHFKLYQFAQKKGDEALMQSSLRARASPCSTP